MTDRSPGAGGDVKNLDADIRVVCVAENACPVSARRDVPRIEGGNRTNLTTHQMKPLEIKRPACEDHLGRSAQKCFMHPQLIVVVFVATFYLACLQIQHMHSRSGIAGEFYDLVVERVKLRVNDCARPTQHHILAAAVGLCHGDLGMTLLFNGCDNPLSTGTQVALAQLRIFKSGQAGFFRDARVSFQIEPARVR